MKQLKITVNGKAYDVQVEEVAAFASAPVAQAPAAAPVAAAPIVAPAAPAPVSVPAASDGSAEGAPIGAPMPGTVNKVLVSAGQAVKKGDVVLVLEAMKMENDIVAPNDGSIGGIMVTAGQAVQAGELLLTLK
ncbi:MAG: biotin/lipoyl-binding protein [Oscillospiraceae bacterium]|nr:biotin/lipoyl-binding protein [Oscillospiraceae bacterium]